MRSWEKEVNLSNLIKRIVYDPIYRSRWSVTFATIWAALMFGYYLALGIVNSFNSNTFTWSWYFNYSVWYLVLFIFKLILDIYLFKKLNKRNKNNKWIDFKLLAVVFLLINFAETLAVAFLPMFFASVFKNKLNRTLTLITIIINSINIVLFVFSCIPVKRRKFTRNEADFLQAKKYISRMGGLFNILIIVMNFLLYFNIDQTNPRLVINVYFAISVAFATMSLVLAIKLLIKRKWDKSHKKLACKKVK